MQKEQELQEYQYDFPYHYLPQLIDGNFRQYEYWSWGFRYLGGLSVVESLIDEEPISSLLDIGCGDGRFVRELSKKGGAKRLVGIDYSARAIRLAKALNPEIDFRTVDIVNDDFDIELFDVVTLIEVIEHVPPESLNRFIERAVKLVRPGGRIIITVPHTNKALNPKHYQHFNSEKLRELLNPYIVNLRFLPFDSMSRKVKFLFRLLGRTGKYFLVTWQPFLNAFYTYYVKHHLYLPSEERSGRIACVGSPR